MSFGEKIKKILLDIRELPLGTKLTIIAVFISLVGLLFGTNLVYQFSGSKQPTQTIVISPNSPTYSDSNSTYSYSPPPATSPKPEQIKLLVGQTATFPKYEVTVHSAKKVFLDKFNEYIIIADVEVKNTDSFDILSVSLENFWLFDSDGKRCISTTGYEDEYYAPHKFLYYHIYPDSKSARGIVVFQESRTSETKDMRIYFSINPNERVYWTSPN